VVVQFATSRRRERRLNASAAATAKARRSTTRGRHAPPVSRTPLRGRRYRRMHTQMPTGIPYKVSDDDRLTVIKGLDFNLPLRKIADFVGVSVPTIETHYAAEIAAANLKRGPKPFEPTEEQRKIVRLASAVGLPHDQIAQLLEISDGSLRTHFRKELDEGSIQANLKVAGNLMKIATAYPPVSGTVTAAIWWTKARMGWKETSRVENTGPNGEPKDDCQVMLLLPDNGRGDCNLPIYRGPRSEETHNDPPPPYAVEP